MALQLIPQDIPVTWLVIDDGDLNGHKANI
jgi:hypothetical protein